MSNIASGITSSVMQSGTQKALMGRMLSDEKRREQLATPSVRQSQFASGTLNLLDEARNLVENATQQGQELNPQIYAMLGLDPQYTDHSAELGKASDEFNAAQSQMDEAQKTLDSLQGIPKNKRSPAQRQQLRQLKKQIPSLTKSLEAARDAHGRLATMPKEITGFNRLDPSQIPSQSPFSQQNPLFQIAHTEAERAQQALEGGIAVDPLLVHQWTQGEASLRAQLAQRLGPDYENTSMGQMALQDFDRRKSESFANWNYQKQQEYAGAAFQQAGQQQALAGGLIGLMREPAQTEMGEGAALGQAAGPRLTAQQTWNQYLLGRSGLTMGNVPQAPLPQLSGGGGLSQLLEQWGKRGTGAAAQTPTQADTAGAAYNVDAGGGGLSGIAQSSIGTAEGAYGVDAAAGAGAAGAAGAL